MDNPCAQRVMQGAAVGAALGASIGEAQTRLQELLANSSRLVLARLHCCQHTASIPLLLPTAALGIPSSLLHCVLQVLSMGPGTRLQAG